MVVDVVGACGMLMAAIFLMHPHSLRRVKAKKRARRA